MSFVFTPEQEDLRESAQRFLADHSPSPAVRQWMATERGFDESVWKQVAELGWTGIAIPEAYGGVGAGFVELAVLLEEMGRALLCAPFFSSVVLAATAIQSSGTEDQKEKLLPGLANGSVRATLAFTEPSGHWGRDGISLEAKNGVLNGIKTYVVDGHTADLLIVAAQAPEGVALYTVDADANGITRTPLQTVDGTRKQARIDFAGVKGEPLGSGGDQWPALSKTLDEIAVCLSCEMVGGAQRCLDMSVDYAKHRTQFGRPIGSFQAIKHKCADMLMKVESSRSAAYYTAWAAAEGDEELPVLASMTKAYVSDAYFHMAAENIEVHGGIGFTWEHDAHLYFRRAKSSELFLGDATYHRELVAQRIGL